MNKLFSALFLLLFCCQEVAAQAPTNSAAKIYYKGVLKHFETLKNFGSQTNSKNSGPTNDSKQYLYEVDKAEEKIKLIKKSQPDYDVSALETELNTYKNQGNQTKSIEENATKDAYNLNKELETLFKQSGPSEFSGKGNVDDLLVDKNQLEENESKLSDYKSLVTNFLNTNPASRIENAKKINRYHNDIESKYFQGYEANINETKKGISKASTNYAIGILYYAKKQIVFWEAANMCYPNNTEYTKNLQLTKELLASVGSTVDIEKRGLEKYKNFVEAQRMPAAVKKDPSLEEKFKTLFSALLLDFEKYKDETVIKVNIISNDWAISRNKITGIIINRAITASIATKKANGKYFVYEVVNYYEDYDGANYLKGYCSKGFSWPKEILLTNIK